MKTPEIFAQGPSPVNLGVLSPNLALFLLCRMTTGAKNVIYYMLYGARSVTTLKAPSEPKKPT